MIDLDDLKYFADRFRGRNKTSGPHWSAVIRIPAMYDEIVILRALLTKAKEALAEAAHQMRNEYPHTFEREIGLCEEVMTDIEEVLE